MASTKTLATALGVTVALALSELQSSVAQPGAGFQNQGIRENLGYPALRGPRYRHRYLGRGYALWRPTATKGSQVGTASNGRIPRPDQSPLEPQPAPDCAFKGPLSNPPTAEETRIKLDYEQQCYRQSEMIVRTRLEQLQNSVEEASK